MSVEKERFKNYQTQDEREGKAIKYPLHLNPDDLKALEVLGKIMQEEKLGTVIKTAMRIGITWALNDPLGSLAWEAAFKKKRNNARLGIIEANVDFLQKYTGKW